MGEANMPCGKQSISVKSPPPCARLKTVGNRISQGTFGRRESCDQAAFSFWPSHRGEEHVVATAPLPLLNGILLRCFSIASGLVEGHNGMLPNPHCRRKARSG